MDKKNTNKTYNILNDMELNNDQFDYKEVYRHIRTSIEFSNVDKDVKVIAITSTQPNEAKSTTSINLANIFAAKYSKVLLIDCDLRKAQLHKYLQLTNKYGLVNELIHYSRTKTIDEALFQRIENPFFVGHLSVLTAGVKIPNPSEILSTQTFQSLISKLKESFDYIIIDCPPISAVSDAIPISHAADGTVFICSSKDTQRRELKQALEYLQSSNVNIIGTILTKADSYTLGYGYY